MNPFEVEERSDQTQDWNVRDTDDIDSIIISERNKEIVEIEKDVADLFEIQKDLALMVNEQGETLDRCVETVTVCERAIEEGTKALERANEGNKSGSFIKAVAIITGSIGIGSLGFIGGPLIGLGTITLTTLTGSGLALTVFSLGL